MKNKLIDTKEFIKYPLAKKIFQLVQPLVDRLLGFHQTNRHFNNALANNPKTAEAFCLEGLKELNTQANIDPKLKKHLKNLSDQKKANVLVANHPYGGIDSLVLMLAVEQSTNGNWKILANKLLHQIHQLKSHSILVDPFARSQEKTKNLQSIKKMHQSLKKGETLCMYPASRVSGWNDELQAVCDLNWTTHPLQLASKHKAHITCVHLDGQNSATFLKIPTKKRLKRTLRLARELNLQQNKKVTISLSSTMTPQQVQQLQKLPNAAEILRAHSYISADKTPAKPKRNATPAPITIKNIENEKKEKSEQAKAIQNLLKQQPLAKQSHYQAHCFQGEKNSALLQEIGILREQTFQAIGAGTGNKIDLASEDNYYHHLIVIDLNKKKIAGAYRIGITQEILANKTTEEKQSLYLEQIFQINPNFYEQLGNALELSRSFITPEYQKDPAVLDLLWKGLGKLAKEKNCQKLYGSVTISADYTPLSQSVLVETLQQNYSGEEILKKQITNANPFRAKTNYHKLLAKAYSPHGIKKLNTLIEEIEENQRSIPPLIRYYINLNARFLSFKTEPSFNDAIYCLLIVDLKKIPPRYQKRFLN